MQIELHLQFFINDREKSEKNQQNDIIITSTNHKV